MYESSYGGEASALIWVIWLAVYFFFAYCQYRIAQKVEHHSPWHAFIPIVQFFQLFKMAGKDWWWIFLCLIPIVNIIAIAAIYIEIAKRLSQPPVWGFLVIIPFLNLVALLYLAFSSAPAKPAYTEPQRQPENVA
jgi:hypothetical protein